MKRSYLSLALAGMLFATACSQDQITGEIGGESIVTFTAELPSEVSSSRAYGEGKDFAKKLTYSVYEVIGEGENETRALLKGLNGRTTIDVNQLATTVEISLVNGKTYDVVFWADAKDNSIYTYTASAETVQIEADYTNATANEESYDAFYGVKRVDVNGAAQVSAKLYRPFAQLNIGTKDTYEAATAGLVVDETQIEVSAYTKLNLFTGDVDGETAITYAQNDKATGTFSVAGANYDYLAMNYILVPADYSTYDVTFTVYEEGNSVKARTYTAVPLQRNYKTNIYGRLLTSTTEFNVEIKPAFVPNEQYAPEYVYSAEELQAAIDQITTGGEYIIRVAADINGDVTVVQKQDVKITILGGGYDFAGVLIVDGKSATYTTAGLTIKDFNFEAESISADACIRLGDGTNATRYTCNVTVENCTFDVPGAVGIKSYTGGDKNLTISGCTATDKAHSLVQATGIDGILVENCTVNSKNGMNFNNSTNVVVDGCTVDVKGYAVRFGAGTSATGAAEQYSIENSSLKSACEEDGDAVIILRGSADNSTLNINNTIIEGTTRIANSATNAKVYIDGNTTVTDAATLAAALAAGETTVYLDGKFETIVAKSGITYVGTESAIVGCVNLNGADNVTLKNITFNAATAKLGYDGAGNAKQYANIITGDNVNIPTDGATNLVIDGCTFNGTFANGGASIAFTDQKRAGGFSGNVTIKNCTFDTENAYYNIYGHYVGNSSNGYGDFVIENNTFKTVFTQGGGAIYLGRYASSTPVVVKNNTFETASSLAGAMYVQDHGSYGVSIDAEGNTFAN